MQYMRWAEYTWGPEMSAVRTKGRVRLFTTTIALLEDQSVAPDKLSFQEIVVGNATWVLASQHVLLYVYSSTQSTSVTSLALPHV